MTRQLGMPAAMVAVMRLLPTWSKLKKFAPTLVYDLRLMEGTQSGEPLPRGRWSQVTVPTLVLSGEKSDAFIHKGGSALVEILPRATQATIPKANHSAVVAAPKRVAEPIEGFLRRQRGLSRARTTRTMT
jgi:pimeloyl-ACP methyl ester carboxylesterase